MSAELKRQGIEYELISNPDWGHMFDASWKKGMKNPEVQDAYVKLLSFLNKHVK